MTWLLLTAGRGPSECRIAVQGLSKALLAEAAEAGVEAEVIEAEAAPHGLMSALVSLRGDGADALARSWGGTVQWVCPSPLRPGWGRKNWFIGVSRLAPPAPSSALCESDLRGRDHAVLGPGRAARQPDKVCCPDHACADRDGGTCPRGAQPAPQPVARPGAAGGDPRWAGTRGWACRRARAMVPPRCPRAGQPDPSLRGRAVQAADDIGQNGSLPRDTTAVIG